MEYSKIINLNLTSVLNLFKKDSPEVFSQYMIEQPFEFIKNLPSINDISSSVALIELNDLLISNNFNFFQTKIFSDDRLINPLMLLIEEMSLNDQAVYDLLSKLDPNQILQTFEQNIPLLQKTLSHRLIKSSEYLFNLSPDKSVKPLTYDNIALPSFLRSNIKASQTFNTITLGSNLFNQEAYVDNFDVKGLPYPSSNKLILDLTSKWDYLNNDNQFNLLQKIINNVKDLKAIRKVVKSLKISLKDYNNSERNLFEQPLFLGCNSDMARYAIDNTNNLLSICFKETSTPYKAKGYIFKSLNDNDKIHGSNSYQNYLKNNIDLIFFSQKDNSKYFYEVLSSSSFVFFIITNTTYTYKTPFEYALIDSFSLTKNYTEKEYSEILDNTFFAKPGILTDSYKERVQNKYLPHPHNNYIYYLNEFISYNNNYQVKPLSQIAIERINSIFFNTFNMFENHSKHYIEKFGINIAKDTLNLQFHALSIFQINTRDIQNTDTININQFYKSLTNFIKEISQHDEQFVIDFLKEPINNKVLNFAPELKNMLYMKYFIDNNNNDTLKSSSRRKI